MGCRYSKHGARAARPAPGATSLNPFNSDLALALKEGQLLQGDAHAHKPEKGKEKLKKSIFHACKQPAVSGVESPSVAAEIKSAAARIPREDRAEFRAMLEEADRAVSMPAEEDAAAKEARARVLCGDLSGPKPTAARRVLRVFFSSTFSDMESERNDLLEDVFSYLSTLARRLGLSWQAVDMRWGVSSESVDDHDVTDICIDEVLRCAAESAGPAFVFFAGDKYGYRPLPARVPAAEFEVLLARAEEQGVPPEDLALCRKWYARDDNAVPPAYALWRISSLLPGALSPDRATREAAEREWAEASERMAAALRGACGALPDEEARRKYTVSVTELEVDAALRALRAADRDDAFFAVRRRIEGVEGLARAIAGGGGAQAAASPRFADVVSRFVDVEKLRAPAAAAAASGSRTPAGIGLGFDAGARELLQRLLERVRGAVPAGRSAELATPFAVPLPEAHVRAFSDAVCRLLARGIVAAARRAAAAGASDALAAEALQHLQQAWEAAEACHGRADIVARAAAYLDEGAAEGGAPLALVGASGAGKSSVMAAAWRAACERAAARGARPVVAGRFLGTTLHSGDARGLLASLVAQLAEAYGQPAPELPLGADARALAAAFESCLAWATPERPLFVILDALDQLSDEQRGRGLAWLPVCLPRHARLLVSILPGPAGGGALEAFRRLGGAAVEVPPFERAAAEEALDAWMREAGRTLQPAQRAEVMRAFEAGGTPLFLRLCWDEARRWRSSETGRIAARDAAALCERLFERLEAKYGRPIVAAALGLVTVARRGLSEAELSDVLSCDDATLDAVFAWWTPPVRRVPPSLLLRVFSDLGRALTERGSGDASGSTVLGWYHRQFAEAAARRYVHSDPQRTRQLHELLAAYFGDAFARGKEHRGALADRRLAPQPLFLGAAPNVRRCLMQPAHLAAWGQLAALLDLCRDTDFLEACARGGCVPSLLSVLAEASASAPPGDPELREGLAEVAGFLGRHRGLLGALPARGFLRQLAANERDGTGLARRARAELEAAGAAWLRLLNKPAGRDPCAFLVEGVNPARGTHRGGKALEDALGGSCSAMDLLGDTHVVVASTATGAVLCFDWAAGERWTARLAPAAVPSHPVRVSNDGARVAVGLLDFPSIAVLSMEDGRLLGTLSAGGLHRKNGYGDRLEALCWSADSTKLASAATGDCSSREIVLYDAVAMAPLRAVFTLRPSGGAMWDIHAHSVLGAHGRSGFGYGNTRDGKHVFYRVGDDEAQLGIGNGYSGSELEGFTRTLAESYCGRLRVVSRQFGAQRVVAVASFGNAAGAGSGSAAPRILCVLGEEGPVHGAAVEPLAGRPGVLRAVVVRHPEASVPTLLEFDEAAPGAPAGAVDLAEVGIKDPGALEWASRLRLPRARPAGRLVGHASSITAMRLAEGGRRLATFDRRDLRGWDLEQVNLQDCEGGDATMQGGPPPALVAAAPLAGGGGASLVASLRAPATSPSSAAAAEPPRPRPSDGCATALYAAATDRGSLRFLRVEAPAGAPRPAPGPRRPAARPPAPLVALELAPGPSAELVQVFVGLEDGGVHAFLVRLPPAGAGAGPAAAALEPGARRASWFHGAPVARIAASTAVEGGRPRTSVASLAYDGTLVLAALGPRPADCSAALLDRFEVRPGSGSRRPTGRRRWRSGGARPRWSPPRPARSCACTPRAPTSTAAALRGAAGHSGRVAALDFAAGGALVSVGADGAALVWDPARHAAPARRLALWHVAGCEVPVFGGAAVLTAAPSDGEPVAKLEIVDVAGIPAAGDADAASDAAAGGWPEAAGPALAASPGLSYAALAASFAKRFSISVGERCHMDQPACWMQNWRDFPETVPPCTYAAIYELEVTEETRADGLVLFAGALRDVACAAEPSAYLGECRGTDYDPLSFNRHVDEDEQMALCGSGWSEVPQNPFRVLRAGRLLLGLHQSKDAGWKSGYGFGAARVCPAPSVSSEDGRDAPSAARARASGRPVPAMAVNAVAAGAHVDGPSAA
eukprot:tig00021521_g22083.t1